MNPRIIKEGPDVEELHEYLKGLWVNESCPGGPNLRTHTHQWRCQIHFQVKQTDKQLSLYGDAASICQVMAASSDLLLCTLFGADVKQYSNLVKTLCFLLQTWKPNSGSVEDIQAGEHLSSNLIGEVQSDSRKNLVVIPESLPKPCFLMSWRRRIPKEDEDFFFNGCKAANLLVADFGARVYCISPAPNVENTREKSWEFRRSHNYYWSHFFTGSYYKLKVFSSYPSLKSVVGTLQMDPKRVHVLDKGYINSSNHSLAPYISSNMVSSTHHTFII